MDEQNDSTDESTVDDSEDEDEEQDYSRLDVTFHLDGVDSQVHEDLVDSGIDVEQEIVNQFSRNVNQFLYGMRDQIKYDGPPQGQR